MKFDTPEEFYTYLTSSIVKDMLITSYEVSYTEVLNYNLINMEIISDNPMKIIKFIRSVSSDIGINSYIIGINTIKLSLWHTKVKI